MLGHDASPEQQARRREKRALRRQRRAAFLGSLAAHRVLAALLMVLCLLFVFAGVADEFGRGWAMIVTGALFGVLALILGWE